MFNLYDFKVKYKKKKIQNVTARGRCDSLEAPLAT